MGKKNQQRSVARTVRRALEADVEQGNRQAENQCNQQGLEEEAAHTWDTRCACWNMARTWRCSASLGTSWREFEVLIGIKWNTLW